MSVGWRNIIEKMHMTATLTKWYEEHGRHEIIAGGKNVKLDSTQSDYVVLRAEDVNRKRQTDLDDAGIAKTAREEKKRDRDEKMKTAAENAAMAKMYRQVVLKEPETSLVQIGGIGPVPAAAPVVDKKNEEVGSFGD